jgi:hypothetical protein
VFLGKNNRELRAGLQKQIHCGNEIKEKGFGRSGSRKRGLRQQRAWLLGECRRLLPQTMPKLASRAWGTQSWAVGWEMAFLRSA